LGTTTFSKPTLLNDAFNDNRAGNFLGGWVYGIGGKLPDGSNNTVNNWDVGVADDSAAQLSPRNSVLQTTAGTDSDPSNTIANDMKFAGSYDVTVNVLAFRSYPAFRQAIIVAEILPPSLMGNYHQKDTTSPARARGAASLLVRWGPGGTGWTYPVAAPSRDIDGDARPTVTGPSRRYDAGSDQRP
jgi:hypothetical protein